MDSGRDQLEILASDFMERLRCGNAPSIEQYAENNPDLSEEILELFPTIAATEQLKINRTKSGIHRQSNNAPNDIITLTPSAGLHLGKYKLQKLIGRGSLGTVWLSHHPDLKLAVAVKILHHDIYGQYEERKRRFLREAQTAAKLNHPHIVRVYDAGVEQNLRYLVMEYVERGSVAKLLEETNGPLPISQACDIATAVADALITIEEVGIVHRDIKPDNILLDNKGIAKLADLGLVSAPFADEEGKMTALGIGIGTPLYVSPEQAMGDVEIDIRSDIYSLGVTLYHMVTGAPPFTGATPYQIVDHHIKAPLKDPREKNPAVSEDLFKVISTMLAKKTADRYQTASALKDDLKRVSVGVKTLAQSPRQTVNLIIRLKWIAASLLLFLVAIVIPFGIKYWSQAEKTSHNPIFGNPLNEQSENGTINPRDWYKFDGPIRHGVIPRPLRKHEYVFNNGVLRLFKNSGLRPLEFFYGATTIHGDFSLLIESKNLIECDIIDLYRDFDRCQILLRAPDLSVPVDDSTWERITIQRNAGKITCKVNGHRAFAIHGSQDCSGRFSIGFPPGVMGKLRKFELLQNGNQTTIPFGANRRPDREQDSNRRPLPPRHLEERPLFPPSFGDQPPPRP